MATQTNAVTQAVETLTGRVTPKAPKPRNTRVTKPQGDATPKGATWDRARELTIGVGGLETEIEKKYTTLADILWILGVRPKDFEPTGKDAKKRDTFNETYTKIAAWVVEGFPKHAQKLVATTGAGVSTLTPEQRDVRRTWVDKVPRRMATILKYIKRHEDDAEGRGPVAKSTLDQSLVKELKKMIERVKKADSDKVTFDAPRVIELMEETIAELS